MNIYFKVLWAEVFFFFIFWDGLRDPIACSLLGGGIPSQKSGYKTTRLCTSLSLVFFYYFIVPPAVFPARCLYRCINRPLHSILPHSNRSLPEIPPLCPSPRSIPHPPPPLITTPVSSLFPPLVS